jgi:hypothetical protein
MSSRQPNIRPRPTALFTMTDLSTPIIQAPMAGDHPLLTWRRQSATQEGWDSSQLAIGARTRLPVTLPPCVPGRPGLSV